MYVVVYTLPLTSEIDLCIITFTAVELARLDLRSRPHSTGELDRNCDGWREALEILPADKR
jgi:hypothetical protein